MHEDIRTLTVDEEGNLFFIDDDRIRKIDRNGTINTVAGTGVSGSTGDGGLAINAKIAGSAIVAFGGPTKETYELFLHNSHEYQQNINSSEIRKINLKTGIITTIAGGQAT